MLMDADDDAGNYDGNDDVHDGYMLVMMKAMIMMKIMMMTEC